MKKTTYCKHKIPMFQSCDKCNRNMMSNADNLFKTWCKEFVKKYRNH